MLCEDDRAGWEILWQELQLYRLTRLPDSLTQNTWEKLMAPDVELWGVGVFLDTYRLAGIAHFSFAPSSWAMGPECQIQDLFVGEEFRGRGGGSALIEAVYKASETQNASQVFWHALPSDIRSRMLFDKMAGGPNSYMRFIRHKSSR